MLTPALLNGACPGWKPWQFQDPEGSPSDHSVRSCWCCSSKRHTSQTMTSPHPRSSHADQTGPHFPESVKRELGIFRRISHCVLSFWTLTVKHLLQRSTICSLRPCPTLVSGRGEAWWRWGAWLCTVRHLCSRNRHGAWSARRRVLWMNQYEAEQFKKELLWLQKQITCVNALTLFRQAKLL